MKPITTDEIKVPRRGIPKQGEPLTTAIIKAGGVKIEEKEPEKKKNPIKLDQMITTQNVEVHRKAYLDAEKMAKARAAKGKK